MNRTAVSAGLVTVVFAALALTGCGGDLESYEITEVREVATPAQYAPGIPETPTRFGFRRRGDNPHAEHGGGGGEAAGANPSGFVWTLPSGWTELPPKQFRQGNWSVGGDAELQAYLTVIPGAGGGVLGNVNRWRGQMGLAPTTAAELDKLPRVPVLGKPALLVEIDGNFGGMSGNEGGKGYRMLGLILSDNRGRSVFVKLVGPKAKVDGARRAFLALAGSLRPAGSPGGAPGGNDGNATPSGLKFVVPKGWTKGEARQMREVTFHPAGNAETECYVTILAAAAGDVGMNVNMWRGQMSQAPLDAEAIKGLPAIEVLGHPARWVEIAGSYKGKSAMGQGMELKEGYRMFALICAMPRATITVKMVGPDKVVSKEKQNFIEFCQSFHL